MAAPGAWLSLVLLFANLLIPVFGAAAAGGEAAGNCCWLLGPVAAGGPWIDLYWLVMPALRPEVRRWAGWICFACWAWAGCGWAVVAHGRRPGLVPIKDPRLAESLAFGEHLVSLPTAYERGQPTGARFPGAKAWNCSTINNGINTSAGAGSTVATPTMSARRTWDRRPDRRNRGRGL